MFIYINWYKFNHICINAHLKRSFCFQICNFILQREDGLIYLKNFVNGRDLDSYLDKMSRRGEWADHVIVIAMAAYLQTEILVITSSTNEFDGNMIWISGGNANQDVVLLGHIFETHYQSLRPCVIEIPKGKISNKYILPACFTP